MNYVNKQFEINYEIMGEGFPIVLLHGFSCDMNLMKGCMEPIFMNLNTKYKRIYIDLPGMGHSSSHTEFASSDKLLATLSELLCDIISGDFMLVGESYGGYLGLGLLNNFASRMLDLILICPVVKPNPNDRHVALKNKADHDELFLSTLTKEDRDNFLFYSIVANEKTYQRFQEEVMTGVLLANTAFLEQLQHNYSFSFNLDDTLQTINSDCHVHFIVGKQDTCVGFEDQFELSKGLLNSSYYLIDYAGHNLQIDQESIFNSIVTMILK